MPYVILKSLKRVMQNGKMVTFYPGDTVKVGKQTAQQWVLDGSALDPFVGQDTGVSKLSELATRKEFGLVLVEQGSEAQLPELLKEFPYLVGPPQIPYKYTFIWTGLQPISLPLLHYGWMRIAESNPKSEQWEMAAGLVSLTSRLSEVGSQEEQYDSEETIGSLEVPLIDFRYLWVRDCYNSKRVIEAFSKYLTAGVQGNHAFTRALYKKQATLCILPADWTMR